MKRKARATRKRRSFSRRTKKQRLASRRRRVYRGGADLPVPEGSVVGVDLDPKDAYSVPVLVSKNIYENEVLRD